MANERAVESSLVRIRFPGISCAPATQGSNVRHARTDNALPILEIDRVLLMAPCGHPNRVRRGGLVNADGEKALAARRGCIVDALSGQMGIARPRCQVEVERCRALAWGLRFLRDVNLHCLGEFACCSVDAL